MQLNGSNLSMTLLPLTRILRSDFESIWSNIMHRDPIPSMDACPMIYYMNNNVFLHSPSLKNRNYPLFLWHM
ncbi:hypothetical protein CR513_38751, partial [Mucuna pruriens]